MIKQCDYIIIKWPQWLLKECVNLSTSLPYYEYKILTILQAFTLCRKCVSWLIFGRVLYLPTTFLRKPCIEHNSIHLILCLDNGIRWEFWHRVIYYFIVSLIYLTEQTIKIYIFIKKVFGVVLDVTGINFVESITFPLVRKQDKYRASISIRAYGRFDSGGTQRCQVRFIHV